MPRETFLAIGERDFVSDLMREPHGRFDGAVAATHDKDAACST